MRVRVVVILKDSGSVEVIRYGHDVPEHRRDLLLDRINGIIDEHWTTTRLVWSRSREFSPFHPYFGIALHYDGEHIVGYAIYRRLRVAARLAIYLAGTGVCLSCERQGVYHAMTRALFLKECQTLRPAEDVYYSWRTRNPTIWTANAKWCRAIMPNIPNGTSTRDPQLQEVAIRLASEMYLDIPVEIPSIVMRRVYDHMSYRVRPRHRTRDDTNDWFDRVIPDPADAIFSVGILTPLTVFAG